MAPAPARRSGDVVYVGRAASVQFAGRNGFDFRIIRIDENPPVRAGSGWTATSSARTATRSSVAGSSFSSPGFARHGLRLRAGGADGLEARIAAECAVPVVFSNVRRTTT
jgi:hypothetical protein